MTLAKINQRMKYLLVVGLTFLPIASFMIVVFLTSILPVFQSMETVVRIGYDQVRPLRHLQLSLLRAVMPPNDFLIHGREDERRLWQQFKSEVDACFKTAIETFSTPSKREVLIALKARWIQSRAQGDLFFQTPPKGCVCKRLADEMETFDSGIEEISQRLDRLVVSIEKEIRAGQLAIQKKKYQGILYSTAAVLLGLLLGIAGSIWLTGHGHRIFRLSMTDPLTGVGNRRALERQISHFQERRDADPSAGFSILMLDLDNFKAVNDRYGHDIGDRVLKLFAGITEETIRSKDILGRYGGEEFVVLLPKTTLAEAGALAERIRRAVESAKIELPDGQGVLDLTVSIGCAVQSDPSQRVTDVLKAADAAMYRAKSDGRNRVAWSPDTDNTGS